MRRPGRAVLLRGALVGGAGPSPWSRRTTTRVAASRVVDVLHRHRTVHGTPGAPGVGDPYFPGLGNGGYDVEHYDLALHWLPAAGELDGVGDDPGHGHPGPVAVRPRPRGPRGARRVEVEGRAAPGSPGTGASWSSPPRPSCRRGAPSRRSCTTAAGPGRSTRRPTCSTSGWQTDGREAFVVSEPSGAPDLLPRQRPPERQGDAHLPRRPRRATRWPSPTAGSSTRSEIGRRAPTLDLRGRASRWPPTSCRSAIGDLELVDGRRGRRRADPPRAPRLVRRRGRATRSPAPARCSGSSPTCGGRTRSPPTASWPSTSRSASPSRRRPSRSSARTRPPRAARPT